MNTETPLVVVPEVFSCRQVIGRLKAGWSVVHWLLASALTISIVSPT